MKLAVLVSGQWRNFDQNIANWSKILSLSGIPFKVFASIQLKNPPIQRVVTPSTVGNHFFFHLSSANFKDFNQALIDDEIVRDCNLIDEYEITDITVGELINSGLLAVNEEMQSRQINGAIMYRGMANVFNLARNELYQNEFTHFLRLRCDFRFKSFDLRKALISHDLFFVGSVLDFHGLRIGDQCFGGKLKYAEKLMKTENQIGKLISSEKWKDKKETTPFAENLMLITIAKITNGEEIGYFPKDGRLIRPRLVFKLKFESLEFLKEVVDHNFRVLKNRLRNFIGECKS